MTRKTRTARKTTAARIDAHEAITNRLIEKLEAGVLPWRKEWRSTTGAIHMPRRATGEHYKGINVLLLWLTAQERGYHADQWMTFNQAKAAGGMVRKGEKGTQIVFYKTLELEDKDTGEAKKIPMARTYTVFNVQQIDDLPEKFQPTQADQIDTGARPVAELDAFYNSTGARILIDGSDPCYRPAADTVHMPSVQQFSSADAYYGTLAHELVHWTGHKTRLDRFTGSEGRTGYAYEELVAELGAVFLTTQAGGTPDEDNSAAYLASWLRALKHDKKFIFKAAAAAQKAADFLIDAAAAPAAKAAA